MLMAVLVPLLQLQSVLFETVLAESGILPKKRHGLNAEQQALRIYGWVMSIEMFVFAVLWTRMFYSVDDLDGWRVRKVLSVPANIGIPCCCYCKYL